MTDTANLGLPCIEGSQAQKHVTHNDALRILDTLVQLAVLDRDLTSPPGSAAEGQRWIVKSGATGLWAGHGNAIAAWQDGGWQYATPQTGWIAYVADEGALLVWNGAAWSDFFSTVTSIQNLALLGIGTTADASNALAAKLNNALFAAKSVAEGGSGDVRCTISKAASTNTASFIFQDNYSGRAEIGLAGDDDFHFKVSPDGASWHEAITVAAATGRVSFPSGGPREVLTANRTYCCDWINGNDANSGLAAGAGNAFKTIQKAWNKILTLDLNGYTVTIQLADGIYTSGLSATAAPIGGGVVLNGNATTPANVVVSTTAADAIAVKNCAANVTVQNLELRTVTSGFGLLAAGQGAVISFGPGLRFGACADGHMRAQFGGYINNPAFNYSIVGASACHMQSAGGIIAIGSSPNTIAVTCSGTLAFGTFAAANSIGQITRWATTYSGGTVTGTRYSADTNSLIQTYGGGANVFPGSVAGTTATGGLYV